MTASVRSIMLRAGCLILSAGFLALSVLIRNAPELISVGSWQIYLKSGRTDPAEWTTIPLLLLLLVAVAVVAGVSYFTTTGRQALRALASSRRNLIWAIVAFLLLALTMMPPCFPRDPQYLAGQETATCLICGSLGVLFLLLALGMAVEFVARPALLLYRWLMNLHPGLFVAGAALFTFLVTNLISLFVFGHTPHVQDTFGQLFQAQLFAQGKLYAPSPPLPQFFDLTHTISNGRWYSIYPPGHPLILALGVLIHAPWVVNPLLGALTVVVIYYLGNVLYDETTARLATLLSVLSPFLLFMSSEYMNHASALFFTCLFILFYARATSSRGHDSASCPPSPRVNALFAGLALGMVILIRPYTAFLLGVPFALDMLYRLYRQKSRKGFRSHQSGLWERNPFRDLAGRFGLLIAGAAAVGGLLLLYNYLTNGHPFLLGYTVKYGPGHGLGFGHSGWGEKLTLLTAYLETAQDLNALNRFLFEFPIPSLLAVALLFASGTRERWDYLLGAVPVMLVGGYFFYWWHSQILFGPRWEYEALGALVLLTARGLRVLPGFVQQNLQLTKSTDRIKASTATVFFFSYLSLVVVALPALVKFYATGYGCTCNTMRTVHRAGLKHAVVFTRLYDDAAVENNMAVNGDVVYARDLGPLNPILEKLYPGRRFYYANEDTLNELTGIEYEHSLVKQGLDDIARQLDSADLSDYHHLLFPVAELEDVIARPVRRYGLEVSTYRQLSQTLVDRRQRLGEYLPALAVWIQSDPSYCLKLFQAMDDRGNFLLGDLRFSLLGASDNGLVLIYDIRPAGDEWPRPLRMDR